MSGSPSKSWFSQFPFSGYGSRASAETQSLHADSWVSRFRQDGYAHFQNLLPDAVVDPARTQILRDIERNYDPARLVEYNNRSWCPDVRQSRDIKRLFQNKHVQAITDQALGRGRYGWSPGQIAVRKARSAERPHEPVAHIDGIPTPENGLKGTEIQSFTALLGIFLTEVKNDFAGNFTVWPGSHVTIEEYFREHGQAALGRGMPNIPLGAPVQLRCKPGDVVLCHYELAHTAAVNTSDDDRIAIFFRLSFNEIAGADAQARKWHNLTHIWDGWRI